MVFSTCHQLSIYSFHLCVFTIVSLFCGLALAIPETPADLNADKRPASKSARSADTCADPSSAETVFQSYRPVATVHVLNYRWAFENANTRGQAIDWADLQPAFRAWPVQHNFTVPLFQLGTADRSQYIYRIGADAQTPPVVSGFNTDVAIVGWVYDTQVCGGVPLMSAALAAFTDHYFTISAFEHDSLVSAAGWTDGGVVAFVLPL